MTQVPEPPNPELTTTRTGGGRSARVIAAGVVALLVVLVYLGISGRAQDDEASPADVGVAALPAVSASPAAPLGQQTETSAAPPWPTPAAATPYPGAREVLDDPRPPFPDTWLATALRLGGTLAIADLYRDPADGQHLSATYRLPLPVNDTGATLELFGVPRAYENLKFGEWDIPLDVFWPDSPPSRTVIDETYDPNPLALSPPMLANGYRIRVIESRDARGGTLYVDVTVGRNPTYAGGTYTLVAGPGPAAIEVPFERTGPGRLSAQIVLPNSFTGGTVDLLLRGFDRSSFLSGEHLADVEVAVPSDQRFAAGEAAFDRIYEADPSAPHRMGLVNSGFELAGTYERVHGKRAIDVTLRLNPIYDQELFRQR